MNSDIPVIVEVPPAELDLFKSKIVAFRARYIRKTEILVNEVFDENPKLIELLRQGKASEVISTSRELGWQKFLIEEANFNAKFLAELSEMLETPKRILDKLIELRVANKTGSELNSSIRSVCGEYAGRVAPYVYQLSLSNTQSRRSRSGSTFEHTIYKLYSELGYPFDSQEKVGRNVFSSLGLGKKVDSVLPSVEAFREIRTKTIIGTMKTSLRERWQEVAEEIARTSIPSIFLLTVDRDISSSKASEMKQHNITLVVLQSVKDSTALQGMRNIISFETYFFEEIPAVLKYWKK